LIDEVTVFSMLLGFSVDEMTETILRPPLLCEGRLSLLVIEVSPVVGTTIRVVSVDFWVGFVW